MGETPFFGHIIDGKEVEAADGARIETVNPWTREPWAQIALGGRPEADLAIEAARRAFDEGPWPGWATAAARCCCTGWATDQRPAGRPDHLYRRDRHRADHRHGRRPEPHPGQPRARGEERQHRFRRRPARERDRLVDPVDLPQRGPDLSVRQPAVRRAADLQRVPETVRGQGRGDEGRRPARPVNGVRPAGLRGALHQGEGYIDRVEQEGGRIATGGVGEGWVVKPTGSSTCRWTPDRSSRRSSARWS